MKQTPFCYCTGNCYYLIHLCALLQAVPGLPGPKGEKVCHCHSYDTHGIFTRHGRSVLFISCKFLTEKANETTITIKLLRVDEKSSELTSLSMM